MKRIPTFTLGLAAVLVLAGCASGSAYTSYDGPTDNPSVGITTHSVIGSGAGESPTVPTASVTPTPSPTPTPTPTPTPSLETNSTTANPGGGSLGGGGSGNAPILSPSGHYYRAGEFCPHDDDGRSTVDANGNTITCSDVNGYYRWHY